MQLTSTTNYGNLVCFGSKLILFLEIICVHTAKPGLSLGHVFPVYPNVKCIEVLWATIQES